jgi:hypothetical protein
MSAGREFLPLPAAAAIAYARLAGVRLDESAASLIDAAATALAASMPIYAGEPPRRLADEELAKGSFRRGGAVLLRADGCVVFDNLYVERTALDAAIDRLKRAGVSFSHVWHDGGRRRLPRVMPA